MLACRAESLRHFLLFLRTCLNPHLKPHSNFLLIRARVTSDGLIRIASHHHHHLVCDHRPRRRSAAFLSPGDLETKAALP